MTALQLSLILFINPDCHLHYTRDNSRIRNQGFQGLLRVQSYRAKTAP